MKARYLAERFKAAPNSEVYVENLGPDGKGRVSALRRICFRKHFEEGEFRTIMILSLDSQDIIDPKDLHFTDQEDIPVTSSRTTNEFLKDLGEILRKHNITLS